MKDDQRVANFSHGDFIGSGIDSSDRFGATASRAMDLDDDGFIEIAVSAINDDDGGSNRGAFFILEIDSDGTVKE